MIEMQYKGLIITASVFIFVSCLFWILDCKYVGKKLLISGFRTVLQLFAIGLILKWIFENGGLYLVLLMALIMVLLAGREVLGRQKIKLKGVYGYITGTFAVGASSLAMCLISMLLIIRPEPWYLPQYLIPFLGMFLGNSMSGIAISLDRMFQLSVEKKNEIEAKLMLGQTANEAISAIKKESLRAGMIPIINMLAAAGIISLPGMMTGQILSGISPLEAVKYQIFIMLIIGATVGLGSMIAVNIGSKKIFDERERLNLETVLSKSVG